MKEVFVIYDENGLIKSHGRVDKEKDNTMRDGSTKLEYIQRMVADGLSVLYLSDGALPNPETHKVVAGEVVPV